MFNYSLIYCLVVIFLISCTSCHRSRRKDEPICQIPGGSKLSAPVITQVTGPVSHGEEPHWDARTNVLYFVDISGTSILKYDPKSGKVTSLKLEGGAVSPVIPIHGSLDTFVVGVDRNVVLVTWNGQNNSYTSTQMPVLATVDEDHPTNRFNDGKADIYGRLFLGTIGYENASGIIPQQASLFRMTGPRLKCVTKAITKVTNSNGLAWNKANDKFYYIDTATQEVAVYDYNAEKGEINNRRIAFDLNNYSIKGHPDGMTIDADDNLWIALYGGGAVIKVNPRTGKLLKCIAIPARDVSSTMWGGANLDILYVTTSKRDLTPEQLKEQPEAGSVFAISNLNARGYKPPYLVRID